MQIKKDIIVQRAKKGDQEAFGKLVMQHQQFAFNLAFRLVSNEDDAKDIVQDSFVKIWKNMKNYDPKMKFTTWMYKIVSHTAIDFLRNINRRDRLLKNDFQNNFYQQVQDSPETILDNKELGQLIKHFTGSLPQKQKLVFVLRDLQGLPSSEVSEITMLPETSVKSNLYHARKIIAKKLRNYLSYERIKK